MAGCLYSLATNPDVQEKLRREVQDVVGKDEEVTPQHIQEMHYLRDTIKETMRYSKMSLALMAFKLRIVGMISWSEFKGGWDCPPSHLR